jgi:hypothetical protein
MSSISTTRKRLALTLALLVACAGSAAADSIGVQIYTSVAPDPTDTSFSTYLSDALTALSTNVSSYGLYSQTTSVTAAQNISTAAYYGSSNPAQNGPGFDCYTSAIGPSCASQSGSIVLTGAVYSSSTPFTLSDVSYEMADFFGTSDSTPTYLNTIGYGTGNGIWGYNALTQTLVTASGADPNTPVTSVYFVGFGDQFAIPNEADLPAGLAQIDNAVLQNPAAGSIQASFTLDGSTFTGGPAVTSEAGTIPEPATCALSGLGVLVIGLLRRRKRS